MIERRLMKPIYYVYNHETGYTACQHVSQESAEKEAERLAIIHPGTEFMVLITLSKCVKTEVVWDRIPVSELPF